MKLKKIFIGGLSLLALTSCNDYLDVDAPSKFSPENIYSSTKEAGTALNGVYAELLQSNTFGQAYTYSLILNSDVDFIAKGSSTSQINEPKRYDMTAASSTANSVWNATYSGIETANNFIYYLENSTIYNGTDSVQLKQYMGEAKVIRAMLYYELLCYWGDVPFTLLPTAVSNTLTPAITSRDVIARKIMEDLIAIAPDMKPTSDISEGIERVSQEACWAMIARMGLQAAGYSLRHAADDVMTYGFMGKPSAEDETWFLTKAREYAGKVINSGTHDLKMGYQDVFLAECNFETPKGDDVIFEIPFAKESSGYIGYRQGPKFEANGGVTNYQWGECGGNQQVEFFYRYSFKPGDTRKDAIIGWWYYTYDGYPKVIASTAYSLYNNKWSKMFNTTKAFNNTTSSNTGINYPYLRYADVLLTYAEADVKLTKAVDPTALSYVQKVRDRAYIGSSVSAPAVSATDSASFMDEILQERKWEFAGENMRWKDLVRNNKLSEVLYHTFLRYNAVANNLGSTSVDVLEQFVVDYDKVDYFGINAVKYTQAEIDAAIPGDLAYGQTTSKDKGSLLPTTLYYCYIKNPKDNSYFANQEMPVLYIFNKEANVKPTGKYKKTMDLFNVIKSVQPTYKAASYEPILNPENPSGDKLNNDLPKAEKFMDWYYSDDGWARDQILYSFYGFMHGGQTGADKANYYFVRNGVEEKIGDISALPNQTNLPVVRYLLPIPRDVITRSEGTYQNYYGY